MNIASILSLTTVDYPGHLASAVYTQGCNYDCVYCYNKELIPYVEESHITVQEAFDRLRSYSRLVDSVVITGGEPTVQKDLPYFAGVLKQMGFLVKLNTNGSNPYMLKRMVAEGKVDYIAMDVKAPLSKYSLMCGTDVKEESIMESLEWLKGLPTDNVEFRTTYAPDILSKEDMAEIISLIDGQKRHVIQPCRKVRHAEKIYGS